MCKVIHFGHNVNNLTLFWVVNSPTISKVFEKLVNNRIGDYLEECDLFSDFQCGFLTVVSDRIARAFKRSGAL